MTGVQTCALPICFRDIDRRGIVVRIVDVVGAGALLGDDTCGTGFEFSVFENREADAAPGEVREVYADAAFDRSWIIGIGEV